MDEEEIKLMSQLFAQLVDQIIASPLSDGAIRAVLCKIIVMQGNHQITKEELLTMINYAWQVEDFFTPDAGGVH